MKTTYKVTGRSFLGHPHGEEFEADLPPEQEQRAKERGSIRVVKRADNDNPKPKKEAGDA
jgi:hypothetical protein